MSYKVEAVLSAVDLGFTAQFDNAIKSVEKLQKQANKVGDISKDIGAGVAKIGGSLTTKLSLPIAAVGGLALKTAANFEKGMSGVRAITGATCNDFTKLRNKALQLGESTSFSASEVTEAMTELAKSGWTTNDVLTGTSGVLDAAAASGENLSSVATIVADTISGFNMKASESGRVADVLTQAANSGTIGINDLGESFKYVGPLSRTMGFNIEEVASALTAMSQSGIKGSQAGTSLRTALTNMVKPTKTMRAAMNELGIEITNQDGSFKSLDKILSIMRNSFSGLTDDQKAYYASIIAGKEGQAGLLSLLNMSQIEYDEISKSMKNAGGVAKETAQIMRDNLKDRIEELGGALETLAIRLGDLVIPWLTEFVEKITNVVRAISDISPEMQKNILKFLAFAAATGPILTIGGKITKTLSPIIGVLSQVGNAFSNFTGLVNPLMDGFAKKVGLAMAISGNKLAEFAPMVTKSIDLANIAMQALFPAAVIGVALAGLGLLYSKFGGQIDQLLAIARDKGPEIIINLANGISQRIPDLVAKGAEMVSKLAEAIATNLPAILTAGTKIVISLVQGVGNNADKLIASALKIIGSFLQGIAENLPKLLSAGLELVGKLVMGIAKNLPLIIESAGKAIVSFIQGISDSNPKLISSGINIVIELVKAIIMSIPKVIEAAVKIVAALAEAILKGLVNVATTVKDGVLGFFKNIFSPGKKKADETGKDIGVSMDNLIADIDSKTSDMTMIMDKNADTAKTSVLGSFGDMSSQAAADVMKMSSETGRSFEELANIAGQKSSDIKTSVTSANADILRDTGMKFSEIQSDMSSKYGKGVDDVKRSSNELSGRIPSDVGQMSNATAREYENLSKRMIKSANDMDRAVSKSFDSISNNVNSSLNKININANSGLNSLGASFNKSFNNIANSANQGVNKVIININRMNDRLNSSFTQSFNRLTSMTRTMWNNFISVTNSSLNKYYSTFNITLNKTSRLYTDHSSRIKSKTVGMWNGIISATNQGASNIARSFAQAGNNMRNVSFNIANSVVGAFRGLGNSLYNLGYNAGIGFNNGLASTQNIIYNMANSIANNVASRIQSALSIHSPSRVMMGLGSYAGEGLAIGLEKSKRYVNSAVDGLSDSIQGVNTSFNSRYMGLESSRQAIPIVVNLKMGRNEFRAMSRDITQEQGRDLRLEANFDI